MTPAAGQDVDFDAIRDGLIPFQVELAVVFGSTVRESTHPHSDVDVGIVFEDEIPPEARRTLLSRMTAEVGSILGSDNIDVVDLETASPAIAYDAFSTGVMLFGEDERRIDLEVRALQQKFDFEPILDIWSAALEERLEADEYGRA